MGSQLQKGQGLTFPLSTSSMTSAHHFPFWATASLSVNGQNWGPTRKSVHPSI